MEKKLVIVRVKGETFSKDFALRTKNTSIPAIMDILEQKMFKPQFEYITSIDIISVAEFLE